MRGINHELAMEELRLHVVSCDHARGDQEFLPSLRAFGEQDGLNIIVVSAINHGAVGKDGDHQTAGASETQVKFYFGALSGVAVNFFGKLDPTPEYVGS